MRSRIGAAPDSCAPRWKLLCTLNLKRGLGSDSSKTKTTHSVASRVLSSLSSRKRISRRKAIPTTERAHVASIGPPCLSLPANHSLEGRPHLSLLRRISAPQRQRSTRVSRHDTAHRSPPKKVRGSPTMNSRFEILRRLSEEGRSVRHPPVARPFQTG